MKLNQTNRTGRGLNLESQAVLVTMFRKFVKVEGMKSREGFVAYVTYQICSCDRWIATG